MKRVLVSILLVLTLVMSSICSVGAADPAVGTLDWFKTKFLTTDPATVSAATSVEVPVAIKVKLSSEPATSYASSLVTSAGNTVDLIAELDMTNVKALVELGVLTIGDYYNSIKDRAVSGQFIINAGWDNVLKIAENSLTTGNMSGFKFYNDGSEIQNQIIFVENGSRVETVSGGNATGVKSTISVDAGVTVDKISGAPGAGELPDKITLEYAGFEVIGFGNVTGSFDVVDYSDATELALIENESYTKLAFNDGGRYVKYVFNVTPASISKYQSGGGGSSGSTQNYTLTYESNGGLVFAKESHAKGKVVELDKVPIKEGYVFDGWYLDAALTEEVTSIKITEDATIYAKWIKERHPVPAQLNGEDHFAYVIGYPDGTVRPNDNITRAEVTTIFFRLLKDEVRDANLAYENVFEDVTDEDWHNTAISTMAKLGIVNGRFEDKFDPDAFITRAEFTAICARFDDTKVAYKGSLNDIDGHWAEDYIKRAAAYGWIEGYNDNTFRPDQFITRAEAMTLINRVLNRIVRSADDLLQAEMSVWSDNTDANEWYYSAVQEATHSTEYDRPNSAYKAWTKVVENRDWAELESTKRTEEPEVTEEPEIVEETEVTEESETVEETENAEQTESSDVTEA